MILRPPILKFVRLQPGTHIINAYDVDVRAVPAIAPHSSLHGAMAADGGKQYVFILMAEMVASSTSSF
jgi:hypothetical protein